MYRGKRFKFSLKNYLLKNNNNKSHICYCVIENSLFIFMYLKVFTQENIKN